MNKIVRNDIWRVRYENPLVGYKGEAVYITLVANSEEEAKERAMKNEKFVGHIFMKYFEEKYLDAYQVKTDYQINYVQYFEGDPRL